MKNPTAKDNLPVSRPGPLILLFLLLSGSCGLIYEVVWMKMLTLVIGNTVFAITTVLTAFMGGLALGSYLAGRLEGRIKQPLKIYGLLEGGIGIYALLLPVFIAGTEPLFRFVYQNIGTSFYAFSLLRFMICGLLLLVSARMNLGNLLLKQKKYQQAIAGYHQVQKLKPDFAITNYNLAMAYFMQNQWAKAEAEWERALVLKPDFPQAQQSLAVVRKKMGSP